jgi:hypothetical protein
MPRSDCVLFVVLGAILLFGCADDAERGCNRGVYTGHVTISDKSDLASYEGYTRVTGNLTITCPNCEAVDELACLFSVGGDVVVSENGALSSLDLGSLLQVGGSLYLHRNPSLTTVDLDRLLDIGAWATIRDNDSLAEFRANQLLMILGDVTISDNDILETLELGTASRILGNLTIENNAALGDLEGLSGLISLGGGLDVSYNGSLPFCEVCRLMLQLPGFTGETVAVENQADPCWNGTALDCTQLPVDGGLSGYELR